jgi:pimeloyl-ACP methyl ester carboxylesterase
MKPSPSIWFKSDPVDYGFATAKDYKIHYEVHGTGEEKIAFVMGMTASMGGWAPILQHFVDQYQCLVFDNRGYGLSTTGSFQRYKTSELAQDAIAVLNHIKWLDNKSIHLVGISMGGMISQHISLLIPERFKSLTLLATCASHRPPPSNPFISLQVLRPRFNKDERIRFLMSILFSDDNWLQAFNPRYPEFSSNFDRMYDIISKRLAAPNNSGLKTIIGQGLAVKTHHVSVSQLKQIKQSIPKILCMTGLKDVMIDPACTEHLGTHLEAKTVLLPEKGHGLPSEAEVEIVRELKELFETGKNIFDDSAIDTMIPSVVYDPMSLSQESKKT